MNWAKSSLKEIEQIYVLTTGGTIDKSYDEEVGVLENRESHLKKKLLTKLRLPYTQLIIKSLMAKDSLYMTDEDRELIAGHILKVLKKDRPIVVLHGTDTMTVTAELVMSKIPNPVAPIIFTGAMSPLGMDNSDAFQNVTEALLAAKLLPAGHYIAFHNRIFAVPHVRKNKEKRTFEPFLKGE